MKFIFFFLLLLTASAHSREEAIEFLPYEFLDSPQHEIPENFKTKTSLPKSIFTKISFRDIEIHGFKAVFEPLENFLNHKNKHIFFTYSNCEEFLNEKSTCEGAKGIELSKVAEKICRPEHFIDDQDLTKVYESKDLNDLRGTLKVILSPLRDQEVPDSLLSHEVVNRGRLIISKLTLEEQKKHYTDSKRVIQQIKQSGCTSAKLLMTEKELNRIQNLVESDVLQTQSANKAREIELRAQGMCRNNLPHPALSDDDRLFFSTYIGALSWRIRGGSLWRVGTQTYRKDFAGKVFENLIVLNSADQGLGKAHATAMVQRLQLKGWSDWFDMGRTTWTESRGSEIDDLLGMTIRGLYQVGIGSYGVIAGASAMRAFKKSGYDQDILKIIGLQMGACYLYASRNLEFHPIAEHMNHPRHHFTHDKNHTAWGELCYGAVMGHGLATTLLKGKACE